MRLPWGSTKNGARGMSVLVYLIPAALIFGLASLVAFLWALRSGKYEDLDGAGERVLIDIEPDSTDARDRTSASTSIARLPGGRLISYKDRLS